MAANNVRDSFDQFLAKKPGNEPSALKSAREKYEAALKKLSATPTTDAKYAEVRDAKRDAGTAMHEARQKAELDYYNEEVTENVRVAEEMKEAQKKTAGHAAK